MPINQSWKSLRLRIIVPLIVISTLTIWLMFHLMNNYLDRQHQRYDEHQQMELVRMVYASLNNLFVSHNHHTNFQYSFENFRMFRELVGIQIVSPERKILFSSNPNEEGKFFDIPEVFKGSELDSLLQLWALDRKSMMAVIPVPNEPACASCHRVGEVIAYTTVTVQANPNSPSVKRSLQFLVGSSALIVIVMLLAAFLLHFRFIKGRLRQIDKGIREYERGNFNARIEMETSHELGRLALRVNHLGERLERMRLKLKEVHENELERADKMASVGELAASIAHEIRNPMSGISNAMQVLKEELPPDDEREPIFEEILRQTKRVNQAINDLLTYARPNPPEFVVGNVNIPLQRALTLMEGQIREGKVGLNLMLDSKPPNVLLDVQQLQQVLVNLILNAIQAMPQGGLLTLKTTHTEDHASIAVMDSGIGILKDKIKEIFKPFFTTKHKGTGLGLSICRSIVESHHGRIELNSTPGQGTTFRIILPIHTEISHLEKNK